DEIAPWCDRPGDAVRVEHVVTLRADGGEHGGADGEKRSQRGRRLDAVLAAGPGAREDARDLLEVIEEEARRRLPETLRLRAPERIQAGEDALQLVGEGRRG